MSVLVQILVQDDSNYWKDLKYADRILKFESGRLMSSTTTSHREFVLRMAMIVKSTTLVSLWLSIMPLVWQVW